MDLKYPGVAVDLRESRYASFETKFEQALDVVFMGYESTRAGYEVDRKTFPFFALELVVGGMGTLVLNGRTFRLQRGAFFTYGPDVSHVITSDAGEPLRKYFIDFSMSAPASMDTDLEAGLYSFTTMLDRMVNLLDGLLQDSADGIDAPAIREYSSRLILELARNSMNADRQPMSAAFQKYLRAKAYIKANYQSSGSICDFAKELHIDTAYLTRLFQRFGTETPYQFLTRLRLSRAVHLLLRHDLPIKEVSETLGFANPFHFSALFRRHYGASPRQYLAAADQEGKALGTRRAKRKRRSGAAATGIE